MFKVKKMFLSFFLLGTALAYPYGDTDIYIKTKYFSNRLQLQQKLVCPNKLYDSNLANSWVVSKFNGLDYEEVGSASEGDYDFSVWRTQSENNVQLHDDPEFSVSEVDFNVLSTYNTRDYLEPDELMVRACVKEVCPTNFEPYPSTVLNKSDYCRTTVNRPKIFRSIPKKIYLVYPESSVPNRYSVPDLGEYFAETPNTEYEVTGYDERFMNVQVFKGISGKNQLVIETKKSDFLENVFKTNSEYTASFRFMVKEKMQGFQNKIGMEFKIESVILSSIYKPKTKELYRCQPLAEE